MKQFFRTTPRAGYAIALIGVACAAFVRHALLADLFADEAPYILFFPAVALAGYVGGVGPGLVATVLSALAVNVYIFDAALLVWPAEAKQQLMLFVFLATGSIVSFLSGSLRDTARRMQLVLDTANDAFYHLDRDWRFRDVNTTAEAYLRIKRSDLVGRTLWEIFPALADTLTETNFRRAMKERITLRFEFRSIARPDHWLDITARGSKDGLSVYFHDLSESKADKQRIEAREQQLRTLTDGLPLLISHVDTQAHYRFNNKAYADWFQKDRAAIAGKHMRELKGESVWQVVRPHVDAVLAGEPRSFEMQLVRVGVGPRDVEVTLLPDLDEERRVRGFFSMILDITERRRAERKISESEQRFRIMADQAPVMVWMSGTDKLFDWLNKEWSSFTGRPVTLELGNGWMESVHPSDRAHFVETYSSHFDARTEFSLEYRLRRADGEFRWLLATGTPRFTPDGTFTGYIGTSVDIHDRRLAEEERARILVNERSLRAEAERANNLKDEFVATLSHELRTPINAIMGWAQLLRSHRGSEAELDQGLEVIERNARAQTQLISDLLDITRMVTGKLRLDVQHVELKDIVASVIESLQPAADAKGVRVHSVLDPRVGGVSGDPGRLHQIVWNLVTNAVKFTPRGGKIQVQLERVNSHIELHVVDTGQGITSEFLPHVFERFRQADGSTTRHVGGLGLGLAIVKQLVELHGGSVSAASAGEGRGATFTVKLPLAAVHGSEERVHPTGASSTPPPLDDAAPLALANLKILLVDDEADARDLVRRVLQNSGAHVEVAASVTEAFEVLERFRPHIVLSDIGMPERDGYEFIRSMRALGHERGGDVPAIALTAFARTEDRVRALRAGFQAHVAKPIEAVELIATVKNLSNVTIGRRE